MTAPVNGRCSLGSAADAANTLLPPVASSIMRGFHRVMLRRTKLLLYLD